MSGNKEVTQFDTKTIKIRDKTGNDKGECTILLQDENGPCPLVALLNTLILNETISEKQVSESLSIASYTSGKDVVKVNNLLELLGEILVGQSNSMYGEIQDGKNTTDVNEVLALLPKLVTGMNVDVKFNGSFDDSPEMSLFRLYDVDVVHGWIADPQDPEYNQISSVGSYDEAQSIILKDNEAQEGGEEQQSNDDDTHSKAQAVRHFLDHNATQLTEYGLSFLRELLSNDSPAVFFRNDHFATIYKHHGVLYTLIADQGYKNEPKIIWQSLTSINGASDVFYDSVFNPSHQQESQDGEGASGDPSATVANSGAGDDYDLAKQLQIDEDAQLAAKINKQQQSQSQQQRSKSKQQSQKKSKKSSTDNDGSNNGKDKTKDKCLIM